MNVLLIQCHPVPESFVMACARTVRETLEARGDRVEVLDLHAEGFQPVLSRQERIDYHDPAVNAAPVAKYVEQLRRADAIVLVFPTWWYGMPALLKGYFDRVWLPGVAFEIDPQGVITTNSLAHVRRMGVVTTSGAPWWLTWLYLSHPLRKVVGRGLRRLLAPGARLLWRQHHAMDASTPASRARFLARLIADFRQF